MSQHSPENQPQGHEQPKSGCACTPCVRDAHRRAEVAEAKVARVERVISQWWPLPLPDFTSPDARDEIRAALDKAGTR